MEVCSLLSHSEAPLAVPHSLDACLFTLTCGSTRRDFSLQEDAWRFTWAPDGRPGSSWACGGDGRAC